MVALEHRALVTPVINQCLHLHPGMALGFFYTWREHHHLVLLQLVFLELGAQGCLDTQPDFQVADSFVRELSA